MLLLSIKSAKRRKTTDKQRREKRERDDTIPFFKLGMSQRFTIVDEGENYKKR